MKKVSQSELENILLSMSLSTNETIESTIIQMTDAKPLKKNRHTKEANPYANINKVTIVDAILNADYGMLIREKLIETNSDEEYTPGKSNMPLELGENNSFIGKYKDEYVIQYTPVIDSKSCSKLIADGKVIDKHKLMDYLPTPNSNYTSLVDWRKVYVRNIKKIKINGITYKVI